MRGTVLDRLALAKARMKYAQDADGKWITLEGGTHVQIDGAGAIIGGPAGLADKGIKHLDDFGKGNKSDKTQTTTVDNQTTPPISSPSVASDVDAGKKTGAEGEKMATLNEGPKFRDVKGQLWTSVSEITPVTIPGKGTLDFAVVCDRPNQPYSQFAVLQKITPTNGSARNGILPAKTHADAMEILQSKSLKPSRTRKGSEP